LFKYLGLFQQILKNILSLHWKAYGVVTGRIVILEVVLKMGIQKTFVMRQLQNGSIKKLHAITGCVVESHPLLPQSLYAILYL
jgi:hypothetical protein